MAEGGPQDGFDAEVDGLVLDEAFVRDATIIELRPRHATAPRPRPAQPPAPKPFWTPARRAIAWRAGLGVVVALALAGVMATLKAHGVGQGPETVAPATHVEAGSYGPGDCVTWPDSESEFATRASPEVVPCDRPHRMEMVGSLRLDEETAYPSGFRMGELVAQHCPPLVRAHLGHDLDPAGRYEIGALHPTIDSWRSGDRALWCAVVLRERTPPPDPDYAEFVGAVD